MKKNIVTRPTTQKIREAIFNILGTKIAGASFLDLFAGTGLVGIDAYLYGAEKVFLVENNYNAINQIKKRGQALNLDLTILLNKVRSNKTLLSLNSMPDPIILLKGDAIDFLKSCNHKFDIIFIDPPYETQLGDEALKIIDERELLRSDGVIIFEHYHKKEFNLNLDNLLIIDKRKYGQTVLTFFRGLASQKS